ncbi:MAG: aminomethyltransferase family protein, partial [Pseudomonadota bacterium]
FHPVNGWERADFFKPDPNYEEPHGFRFSDVEPIIGAEVTAVQASVGLAEVNGFTRIELTGRDVHAFLDRLTCGLVPKRPGRVGLTYLLNDHGMIKSEATIANIPASDRGPDRVWYGAAAAAEWHDRDWLAGHIQPDEDVRMRDLTDMYTILVLAGPKAREVLSSVSRADWSQRGFPWLSARECFVGIAPATVYSLSFSGELAYEIHVPTNQVYAAYLALRRAGQDHGMRLFGSRAIESMRLEKGFLHWKSDLLTEFDPFEAGLSRFVKLEKQGFIGREALMARHSSGPRKLLVTLDVACDHAPSHAGASVMRGGTVCGTVTSGAWGHRVGRNLALAYVDPETAPAGSTAEIDILGDLIPATVIAASPYDPDMSLPRN